MEAFWIERSAKAGSDDCKGGSGVVATGCGTAGTMDAGTAGGDGWSAADTGWLWVIKVGDGIRICAN